MPDRLAPTTRPPSWRYLLATTAAAVLVAAVAAGCAGSRTAAQDETMWAMEANSGSATYGGGYNYDSADDMGYYGDGDGASLRSATVAPGTVAEPMADAEEWDRGPGRTEHATRELDATGIDGNGSRNDDHGTRPVVVRRGFPEVLLSDPVVFTDAFGNAEVHIDRMADSITTWRVDVLGHTADGVFGEGRGTFRVFKEFFLNLQVPAALTVGDQLQLPLSVFNYEDAEREVTLTVVEAPWFVINGESTFTLRVPPGTGAKSWLDITVVDGGTHVLDVTARSGELADRVAVPLRIDPPGIIRESVVSVPLNDQYAGQVRFPATTDMASRSVELRVYPTTLASVFGAARGLAVVPTGCLEQTLSKTWIDVQLAAAFGELPVGDAIRDVELPPIVAQLELAYQRILGYRDAGTGRFASYPGRWRSDFDMWLDGYALLVLKSMQPFVAVDDALIAGLEDGFAATATDSLSRPDARTLLTLAAYLQGRQTLPRRMMVLLDSIAQRRQYAGDAYQLALWLRAFAAARDIKDTMLRGAIAGAVDRLLGQLLGVISHGGDEPMLIGGQAETLTWARGLAASEEVAAHVLLAMSELGVDEPAVSQPLLSYMLSRRDGRGLWSSTQSTALMLRALAVSARTTAAFDGEVTITGAWNGTTFGPVTLGGYDLEDGDADSSEAWRQRVTPWLISLPARADANVNELTVQSTAPVTMQVIARASFPDPAAFEPASAFILSVEPEKPSVFAGETLKLNVHCQRRYAGEYRLAPGTELIGWWPEGYRAPADPAGRPMPTVIEVGLPGTTRPITDALDALVNAGRIERYDISGRRVILYLRGLGDGAFDCQIPITAVNPSTAQAAPSRVWEYYNPQGAGVALPFTLRIAPRD